MLDREVVEEFLDLEFEDLDLKVPEDITEGALVQAFCQYIGFQYHTGSTTVRCIINSTMTILG